MHASLVSGSVHVCEPNVSE